MPDSPRRPSAAAPPVLTSVSESGFPSPAQVSALADDLFGDSGVRLRLLGQRGQPSPVHSGELGQPGQPGQQTGKGKGKPSWSAGKDRETILRGPTRTQQWFSAVSNASQGQHGQWGQLGHPGVSGRPGDMQLHRPETDGVPGPISASSAMCPKIGRVPRSAWPAWPAHSHLLARRENEIPLQGVPSSLLYSCPTSLHGDARADVEQGSRVSLLYFCFTPGLVAFCV